MSEPAPSKSFPIELSQPDRKALATIAAAYQMPLPEAAAALLKVLLRSLPPLPDHPGEPLVQYVQNSLAQASQLSSAALKSVAELDHAASRTATLIDLLEPAIHRLQTIKS
jgi:hypothetical protein